MGGNVFKGKTSSIRKEYILPTVEKYFAELGRVFPHKKEVFNRNYYKFVGSVLKKDVSGDIDYAIDVSTIADKNFSAKSLAKWGLNKDEVQEQMLKYKKRARTATDSELMIRATMKGIVDKINAYADNIYCDEKKIGSGSIFTLFPQYNEAGERLDTGVQMDWLIGNMEWLEFSYYSDKYEGNVKGLHRTQLILSMFNALGLSFNHQKGVKDMETGETVAKNPKEAIKILEDGYNIKLSKNIVNDYFKLMEIVNKLPKKKKDEIIGTYLKILDKTRCDIPEDLQDTWKKRKNELKLTGKFLPDNSMLVESSNFKKYIHSLM